MSGKAATPFPADSLQAQVGFSLAFPGYVPNEVSFAKYVVHPSIGTLGPSVQLLYGGPKSLLVVEESKTPRSLGRDKGASLQVADIDGQQILLQVSSPGSDSGVSSAVTSAFRSGELFVVLDATNLSADEVIKVIRSFPSPLEVQ